MSNLIKSKVMIGRDIYGREFEYLSEGMIKGRNTLLRMGFTICENKYYMKNNNRYFHYNRIKKAWIGEEPVLTDYRVLIA